MANSANIDLDLDIPKKKIPVRQVHRNKSQDGNSTINDLIMDKGNLRFPRPIQLGTRYKVSHSVDYRH